MKNVAAHINSDQIRNQDGTVSTENGIRLLCEALDVTFIYNDEVDADMWDETLEFLNNNSFEYIQFVCEQAGLDTSGVDGDILLELAFQVELNKSAKRKSVK